jgi:hypothetical protein
MTTTFISTGNVCGCSIYEVFVDGRLAGTLERQYNPATDLDNGSYTWAFTGVEQGSPDNNEYDSLKEAKQDLTDHPPRG